MKKLILGLLLVVTSMSYAQDTEFRKYANNFLYQGVDSRGRALGNAVSSTSEDVFAGYYNPAGLVHMNREKTEVGYMHVFDGLYNYDVAGIAFPTNRTDQALGFTAVRYAVDDIPNTIFLIDSSGNIDPSKISTFSSADYGGFLTYSKQLPSNISIGGSAKIIHRSVGDFAKAWGAGIDFGARYTSYTERLKISALGRDIFGTYASWDFDFSDPEVRQVFENTGNILPEDGSIEASSPTFVIGASYEIKAGEITITPQADFDITLDGERPTLVSNSSFAIDPHAGIEFEYDNSIFLRAGVNNIQKLTDVDTFEETTSIQPSVGAGVKTKSFALDYALTQFDFREEFTHLITLKLGFNRKSQE